MGYIPLVMMFALVATVARAMAQTTQSAGQIAIAIHGGAGTIERAAMTREKEAAYCATLEEALKTGHKILLDGGTSMDAVTAAVRIMEDSPLFNAGKGAVYTADEKHELDAAVMDGRTRASGAVAAVSRVKNPIDLARLVMEKSPHVLLVGEGAEQFAREQRIELVDPSYFDTPQRLEQLRKEQQRERAKRQGQPTTQPTEQEKHGTVGAVALDRFGNLAAATSTGGMTNKRFGRVGDTPLIGAGTYADNATCAASGTGHGEYFMRLVLCHEIASQMRYAGKSVTEAADDVVMRQLVTLGGTGGAIAIDRHGNIAMPFNTRGMYRGSIDTSGKIHIAIFKD
jgi:beta-aspartyl-peptidase (threonine type)